MTKYLMMVYTNPVEGREADYNEWYNNVHLGEVLQLPGFVAAQRFAVEPDPSAADGPAHKYLAIYELETDDPQKPVAAINDALVKGELTMSDAVSMSDPASAIYGPVSDRMTST